MESVNPGDDRDAAESINPVVIEIPHRLGTVIKSRYHQEAHQNEKR